MEAKCPVQYQITELLTNEFEATEAMLDALVVEPERSDNQSI